MSVLLRAHTSAAFLALAVLLLAADTARATVTIQWVPVHNAGNAPDANGKGAVATNYAISKYEITNAQYVEFLNAKDATGANLLELYSPEMSAFQPSGGIEFTPGNPVGSKYSIKAGRANRAVMYTSYYASLRFANWIHNGQGSGSTETGAYELFGGGVAVVPTNSHTIFRNPGAKVYLPTENEWYKAAYYKGGSTNAGYWSYATQSNTQPTSAPAPGTANPTNSANYYYDDNITGNGINEGYAVTQFQLINNAVDHLTDVGAYDQSPSAYGTFDQNGSAYEWVEDNVSADYRRLRGGAWAVTADRLISSDYVDDVPEGRTRYYGFRLASVPEPGAIATLLLAAAAMLKRRARRIAA